MKGEMIVFAVALGYPLGVKDDKYILEYNSVEIAITFQEAAVWMSFNGVKEIRELNEDEESFEKLVSLGIILKADDFIELGKKMGKAVPIRQGAGSLDNGKVSIFLGDQSITPSDIHYSVWKLCNGKRSLLKIYKYIKIQYMISYEEFIKILSYLDETDLIFFPEKDKYPLI